MGKRKLLKDGVHMVFHKASGLSQNREKGKRPAAPAGSKPNRLGTNGPSGTLGHMTHSENIEQRSDRTCSKLFSRSLYSIV